VGLFPVAFPAIVLDGGIMNYEIANPTELSVDQVKTLVNIISDQFGTSLSIEDFADQVSMLFEDISGFEMISDSESRSIINQLWSYYHGPDK
jgi:hypothetical protein